ncbi:hypothetical protein HCJ92_13630 [Streptomyces sp. ventii]|uniref:DUF6351 domain-containing protein n=1 Tax=Streptomyces spiramenti TaxID=2720606 RepID=A0ABX1AJL0_9ACTN|nr:DUF6351 family protein [Streptomyces spiramenti]NJP67312.1 hypothetical protein [Streptomyces spiramenti]
MRPVLSAVTATVALTATLAGGSTATAAGSPGAPERAACPAAIADTATCYSGKDGNGSYYTLAVPADWNGSLVVHAHGGPSLTAGSDPERSAGDLERWTVMVEEGYAWAGSSYRRGGYGTRMAAEDTETVRQVFVDRFGEPELTLLHGQSWGGNVAAKTAEVYGAAHGTGPYDGLLLTNGVLAGGSRGYDYRVDLRVVHQYYCGNHPRPEEPQYPLWQGLPAGAAMTSADLRSRLLECTGHTLAPEDRTRLQQRNLDDITAVTGIPESSLESHLRFATVTFSDIVNTRLDGRNPFSNVGVRYRGSHDDDALNRGVERFAADRTARRDLSFDSDLTGRVAVPVLTLHAIGDATAFVEHEAAYRATLRGAGRERHLLQTFTRESEHSGLSDAGYATALDSLAGWVRTGQRPTGGEVARSCPAFAAVHSGGCHFDPAYRPADYHDRVNARPGGRHWPAMSALQEAVWARVGGVGIAP